VTIPLYGVKEGTVDLSCDFALLTSERLLFLKWFRNDEEFFRFTAETESFLPFPLEGVFVDVSSPFNLILRKQRISQILLLSFNSLYDL
jgi:hypothetical protein